MTSNDNVGLSNFTSVPVLPSAVEDALRKQFNHLKVLPAISIEALEMVKVPDCSLRDFSTLVERDVSLATDVLRLANTILFGANRPILQLHQAIVRLGLRQCKNLIITSSICSLMVKLTRSEGQIIESLWRHSFVTALLSVKLNQSLKAGFEGEEFASGLIHDIGRMLLAACFSLTFEENEEILHAEAEAIDTDHCEVGAWFVHRNALPAAFSDVVRFHHKPELSEDHRRLVALIAASDHMANYMEQMEESQGYDPRQNLGVRRLEECGIRWTPKIGPGNKVVFPGFHFEGKACQGSESLTV